jgi:antitoxin component YwqK of YwqJK toxin-antitoxin module
VRNENQGGLATRADSAWETLFLRIDHLVGGHVWHRAFLDACWERAEQPGRTGAASRVAGEVQAEFRRLLRAAIDAARAAGQAPVALETTGFMRVAGGELSADHLRALLVDLELPASDEAEPSRQAEAVEHGCDGWTCVPCPWEAESGNPLVFDDDGPERESPGASTLKVEGATVDGLREGRWTYAASDGSPLAEGDFSAGARTGVWTYYRRDGSPRKEGHFAHDRPHGVWRGWEADGRLAWEGPFVQGVAWGVWTFWWNPGVTMAEGLVCNGQAHGPWALFDDQGDEVASGPYVRGTKRGVWRLYDTGTEGLGWLEGGVREGLWREWNTNEHQRETEGKYVRGVREGRWTEWFPEGPVRSQGDYRAGQKHGPWFEALSLHPDLDESVNFVTNDIALHDDDIGRHADLYARWSLGPYSNGVRDGDFIEGQGGELRHGHYTAGVRGVAWHVHPRP